MSSATIDQVGGWVSLPSDSRTVETSVCVGVRWARSRVGSTVCSAVAVGAWTWRSAVGRRVSL